MSWVLEHILYLCGLGALAVCLQMFVVVAGSFRNPKIPTVGIKSKLEAGLVSNFRFYKNAEAILVEGYAKVGFRRHCLQWDSLST